MPKISRIWDIIKSPSSMAIVALIGFALAIYQGFFYEKRGEVSVSIDAVSRVFDVHQPVGGLEISYDGENLRTTKKTLWAMTFTVRNSGNAEIRKGDYDDNAPFGFQVLGAEVVDHPTVKASNDYLNANMKVNADKNHITLSPAVFEPEDYIQIGLLLLGPESTKPAINPIGKIAGIKQIQITTDEGTDSGKSIWKRVTAADSLWVHPVRAFVYGFGGFFGLILLAAIVAVIISPFEYITRKRTESERRRLVSKYKSNQDWDRETRFLTEEYVRGGDAALLSIYKVLRKLRRRTEVFDQFQGKVEDSVVTEAAKKIVPLEYEDNPVLNKLKESGLLEFQGARPNVSQTLESSTVDFGDHVKADLKELYRTAESYRTLTIGLHSKINQEPIHIETHTKPSTTPSEKEA